jgi:hypothetical protein
LREIAGGREKVNARFSAKSVTALSSRIAEYGSTDQAHTGKRSDGDQEKRDGAPEVTVNASPERY